VREGGLREEEVQQAVSTLSSRGAAAPAAPAASAFVAGGEDAAQRRRRGLGAGAERGPRAGGVAEVILRGARGGGGEGQPLVGVEVAVVVDARVGYHDPWQRATISVVTQAAVVRPRGAGVIQEGLLTKRQVIHHSCALLCRPDERLLSAKDKRRL